MYFAFFLVSFLASIVGAICGIGGGVIMKPLLDATGILSVSAINRDGAVYGRRFCRELHAE